MKDDKVSCIGSTELNNQNVRFSVWTPSYNREILLNRLYDSLLAQTFSDFEWIIIDDGSTDGTERLCEKFIDEGRLKIRYFKKENGGKHTAWREATKWFRGKYVVTIDSDDFLLPEALEIFDRHWKQLESDPDYDSFWEVKALCQNEKGEIIGASKPLPADIFDATHIDMVFRLKYNYEMEGCRKTEVLRNEAKVPDHFDFEEFCSNYSEGMRWINAGRKYKTRYVRQVVRCYCSDAADTLCRQRNFGRNASLKRTYNTLVSAKYYLE